MGAGGLSILACERVGGKPDRDQEAAGGAGGEVEGPTVGADDAVHDGKTEAGAGVLAGARAFGSALEGLDGDRDQVRATA